MIDVGARVPDLPLTLSDGAPVTLHDYANRWLVLYFYPKDATPGCTTQGRDLNELLPQLRAHGAEVVGVSRDSLKSHAGFASKQGLEFALASDPDEVLCAAFDVIRDKQMCGRAVRGIERSTFLIDPHGRIAHAWRKVRVPGHAHAVLDALRDRQLSDSSPSTTG